MQPHLLFAHAFGQVYTLPLPVWLYLYGGAAAVVLSFIVIGFLTDNGRRPDDRQLALPFRPTGLINGLRAVSLLLFGLTIATGAFGHQYFVSNFSVTWFWVIFYLGFTYLTLLVGNLWDFINPVRLIVTGIEKAARTTFQPRLRYPERLGYWPALILYFGFIWLELLSRGFEVVPFNLAGLLIIYTLLTICGVVLYGKEVWFARVELSSVFLGIVARLALLRWEEGRVYLRPPFVGLLDDTRKPLSLILFVIFMLASTAFDGLQETRSFATVYRALADLPILSLLSRQTISTLILIVLPLVFLAAYWLCILAMKPIAKPKLSTAELASRFAFSLAPIAVAYNIAHYFTLLLVQGQNIIKLLSDPFGWGWNLFHTTGFTPNPGLVSAATVWYSQVALIVVGHIIAVYLAHRLALRTFSSTKKALASQYPILVLMVIYTMTSLWVIAQPFAPLQ